MTELGDIAGVRVELRRSTRRRTVALHVRPGEVVVYAPTRVPISDLRRMLRSREAWITRHLTRYAARVPCSSALHDGAVLPFMGDLLTLRTSLDVICPTRDGAELLHPPASPEQMEALVEGWRRRACLPAYRVLTEEYAGRLGARHRLGRVAVTSARLRWGSCTAQGDIRLHWKLSRAPLEVVRYVALHEAAHLLELNHSARYWALVAGVMPEYRERRQWLGDHGHTL